MSTVVSGVCFGPIWVSADAPSDALRVDQIPPRLKLQQRYIAYLEHSEMKDGS